MLELSRLASYGDRAYNVAALISALSCRAGTTLGTIGSLSKRAEEQ